MLIALSRLEDIFTTHRYPNILAVSPATSYRNVLNVNWFAQIPSSPKKGCSSSIVPSLSKNTLAIQMYCSELFYCNQGKTAENTTDINLCILN